MFLTTTLHFLCVPSSYVDRRALMGGSGKGAVKLSGAPGTGVRQCPLSAPASLWGRASLGAELPSL